MADMTREQSGASVAGSWLRHRRMRVCVICVAGLTSPALGAFDIIKETGPSTNRINAFFMGDGYTASDISAGIYATHVQNYVNYMFSNNVVTDPFYRYRNFFNLYRVNVVSAQSGADEPQNGVARDTALDATYRYDGVTDRLLYVSDTKAANALNSALQGSSKTAQMRFITVNDSIYGGGGGTYAVYAGGNSSAREIAMHENAHSFDNLADEYGGTGTYPGNEPAEINVTKNSTGAKWSQWLGYNDPTGSTVDAYVGGRYYDSGIYRPTANSKMRTLGSPFNAIGREKIILDIYARVRPLDSYTSFSTQLVDPANLVVSRVDDNIINTQWSIDGTVDAAANNLSVLDFSTLNLNEGAHVVSLRAYDPTGFDPINGWVRTNTQRLQETISWNVLVTVPEPGTLLLLAVGTCGALVWRRRSAKRGMAICEG